MNKEFRMFDKNERTIKDRQLEERRDILTKTIVNTLEEKFGTGCLYLKELQETEYEIRRREFNTR